MTPDRARRGNEALRRAMQHAGITPVQLAEELQVTEKAVMKWVNEATVPYARNRHAAAVALKVSENILFPGAAHAVSDAMQEVVGVWPRRGDCPLELWWNLFTAATERIDVLGYATLFLTESHLDLVDQMATKAEKGCAIRIVLADPACQAVADRDHEEGLDGTLAARIRSAIRYYAPLFDSPVGLRLHSAPMYTSSFCFDDEMLVTPHLYRTPGKLAPLLHLRRMGAGGIFDRYAKNFERIWIDGLRARRPE